MIRRSLLYFFSIVFLPFCVNGQNSPLFNGKWVKIAVAKQGIYQLSGTQLKAMGFSLPFPSSQAQLFNYNLSNLNDKVVANPLTGLVENSIQVNDGGDNQFDEKDYLLFYSEGPIQWKYEETKTLPVHYKNASSDSIFYFITTQGSNGKRILPAVKINAAQQSTDNFDDRWLIEKDSVSLLNSGKLTLGTPMGQGTGKQAQLNYTFAMDGLLLSSPLKIISQYAATAYQSKANFNLLINTNLVRTSSVDPVSGLLYQESANIISDNFSYTWNANTNLTSPVNFTIAFSSENSTATGWIDFIEINAKRKIGFWGTNAFSFRNFSMAKTGLPTQYQLQNLDTTTMVWDVTRPEAPLLMPLNFQSSNTGNFIQTADTLREFFALKQASYETPVFVANIDKQNLVGTMIPDYIIIAATNFLNAAKKLSSFHETNHGLKGQVYNVNEIFNEFSGGQATATGIRNFIQYLFTQAALKNQAAPKYLLLMGMANYSYKNYNSASQIPVFESAASTGILTSYPADDYYNILNVGDDINAPNAIRQLSLAIGRLPVRTAAEADTVVDKIINYQKINHGGAWKNQLTWVADDGDYNLHLQDAEDISTNLQKKVSAWNQKKIYLDLYPVTKNIAGNTYPLVNANINQAVNNGTLILNYTGHGNYLRLTEEAVITQPDIQQWNNAGKLPLMITASCDFAPYDQPQLSPIGFDALLKNSKGVVALVAASRLVDAYSNKQINDQFIQKLLVPDSAGRFLSIGWALQKAKMAAWAQGEDHVNTFKFTLLGDPAMYLAKPNDQVVLTAINGKTFMGKDSLEAGGKYTMSGLVQSNGQTKNNFKGLIEMTLYDAANLKKTLGNIPASIPVNVSVQENILFKGTATVNAGKFNIDFILPKEVTLNQGALKLQLNAYNDSADAMGIYTQLFSKSAMTQKFSDTIGPAMQLFLNDTNFINGGWAPANSTLLVRLKDDAGIQTSGNSLGHDLSLLVDGDTKNEILLNNYYTAAINTYQTGSVQFALPNLSLGAHQIVVKAWDLLGNSNKDTLNFIVPDTSNLLLNKVSNFPNPFTQFTYFSFEQNQLGNSLEVNLNVYNNNGQLLFTRPLSAEYKANRVISYWDGASASGGFLNPGTYFYKITLSNGKQTKVLTNKLVKF
jgi:Peptidase family C25